MQSGDSCGLSSWVADGRNRGYESSELRIRGEEKWLVSFPAKQLSSGSVVRRWSCELRGRYADDFATRSRGRLLVQYGVWRLVKSYKLERWNSADRQRHGVCRQRRNRHHQSSW